MTEHRELREKAIGIMCKRGWKEKVAKKRSFEQSLFDHTIIELDVLETLFRTTAKLTMSH